jgi:hypothetical protein
MKSYRARDRRLQLFVFNEEFLVNVSHQLALITSLPFVHTARRSYRLSDPVSCLDWLVDYTRISNPNRVVSRWEILQTLSLRGRRSRNKVSVGEPAEGSFTPLKYKSKICSSYNNKLCCLLLYDVCLPNKLCGS